MTSPTSRFAPVNPIPVVSTDAARQAEQRQAQLTKPTGSLGRLERLVVQLAAAQDDPMPAARPAAAVLFAADHGVHEEGVSAYPQEVTTAMVRNFVMGGAAASVACRRLGLPLWVVDVGVADPASPPTDPSSAVEAATVVRTELAGRVSHNIRTRDAMDVDTLDSAMGAGRAAIDALERDVRVVVLGEMGIANTTVASAIVACMLGDDVGEVVGIGTGIDPVAREHKVRVVRDVVARVGRGRDPSEVLRRAGGHEIAALVGAILRCAETRRVVLVDGFIVSAAAMVACSLATGARPYLVFGHQSAEPGHRSILAALNAEPLLDLKLRLGEGSGALLAFPLLENAIALHSEMATFEEAAVPDRPTAVGDVRHD